MISLVRYASIPPCANCSRSKSAARQDARKLRACIIAARQKSDAQWTGMVCQTRALSALTTRTPDCRERVLSNQSTDCR